MRWHLWHYASLTARVLQIIEDNAAGQLRVAVQFERPTMGSNTSYNSTDQLIRSVQDAPIEVSLVPGAYTAWQQQEEVSFSGMKAGLSP